MCVAGFGVQCADDFLVCCFYFLRDATSRHTNLRTSDLRAWNALIFLADLTRDGHNLRAENIGRNGDLGAKKLPSSRHALRHARGMEKRVRTENLSIGPRNWGGLLGANIWSDRSVEKGDKRQLYRLSIVCAKTGGEDCNCTLPCMPQV